VNKKIPADFPRVRLGDVVDFNPKESLSKGASAKKISMEHLRPYTRDVTNYELAAFSGGSKFRNGDTLMARITPCLENGKIAQVKILEEDEVGFGSTEFIVMRGRKDVSDSDFVYYLANTPVVRDIAIKSMMGTSGRQRVQQDVLENLPIPLPPLPVQRSIAATLSCLDDKIELNRRVNANLEAQAQALFKRWFVDFESFQAGDFVDSELGNLISFVNGFAFKSNDYVENGLYKLITIKNVQDGLIDTNNVTCLSDFPVGMPENVKLNIGDILMSLTGNVGRVGIVTEQNLLLNQRVAKVVPNNPECLPFFYFFFRQKIIKEQLINLARGTAQANLSPVETLKIHIKYNKARITEYSNIVFPLYNIIVVNMQQSRVLAAIRDTLLSPLMSGEIEVEESV